MSKSVTIICPNKITINSIGDILKLKFTKLKFDIQSEECYIDSSPLGEYDYVRIETNKELHDIALEDYLDFENTSNKFKKSLMNSQFLYVSYNNKIFLNKILEEFFFCFKNSIEEIWLDNDYGKIIEGKIVMGNGTNW